MSQDGIKQSMEGKRSIITPDRQIIDILEQHRETERVFKKLEQETGECICCQALFLSLSEAAERYGFDLQSALAELQSVIDKQDA